MVLWGGTIGPAVSPWRCHRPNANMVSEGEGFALQSKIALWVFICRLWVW